MVYHRVVVTDEREAPSDEALVREAKPAGGDAVAEVMRASLRRALLGVEAPAPTLGRFSVLARVGGGAMGPVLAAYDPVLDRKVAIKVLRERGEAAKARVLAEARALARLSHPNVVAVHEADEHAGDPFDSVPVQTLQSGVPILKRSSLALDCEVVRHFDLEADCEIYMVAVLACRATTRDAAPAVVLATWLKVSRRG